MKNYKKGYLSQQEQYGQLQQLIKKSYEGTSDIQLYVQIDQITQWVNSQNSKPLLITSHQFGGKKTLICEFIKNFQKHRTNRFVISQFASVTPNYSEILYKITIQLRTLLGINQKVELNQEKLRQYFRYWLQVADEKIQKDYLGYAKQQKMQVVIIIEGVDKVVDNKNQNVRPSFWLPDVNLKNLKIILTSQTGDKSLDCLFPIISHKIQYVISEGKIHTIKQRLLNANAKLKSFSPQTHFGDLKIALKILTSHPQFQINQSNLTFQQFFSKFISFASKKIGSEQQICYLLGSMIWSKKGLSVNTLRRSFKITPELLQQFLTTFKDILIKNQNETYLIINRKMRIYINQIVLHKLSNEDQIKKKIHGCISKALKRESNTVDTLEEMIYHLSCSYNYTELKQLLSRIENFLVLYTPLTKHLLCMCWFLLEIQFQYDPVFEYNKAIQRFLNHYYPSPEDTFKIIFQLSLFFKQYSQFENTKTPQFRHPPVRGEVDQLKQISIYQQLMQMNMYQKNKVRHRQSLSSNSAKLKTENEQKQNQKEIEQIPQVQQFEIQRKEVQKLNVRIKFHQQKFKSLYLEQMQPYINQFYVLKKKNHLNNNNQLLDEEEEDSQNQIDQSKIDLQKIRKGLLLKKYSDYCEEQYHRCSLKRSFYYYKQWIWMQFPWICQSLNNNYSQLIDRCMKSPTEYMTIDLEQKLISDAVKIAKIAKQNKRQIYQNKYTDLNLNIKVSKKNESNVLTNRTKIKNNTSYLKNKQKFDLSKLDLQLQKSTVTRKTYKPSKHHQNDSSTFVTDLSGNQSYFEQKENNETQSQVKKLPYILKCSNLAASKAQKINDISDMRQYGLLITKLDELKYQNSQLVTKIQTLELNRQTLKQNNRQTQKQSIKQKIEELKQRKLKLIKNYKTQEALKVKLQMIIKLCDINKSHGSQSAHLNGFLNSLKLMFKIQQQNLQIINQNGKKILEDSKNEYKKIKEEKSNMQAKLKREKNKVQKTVIISTVKYTEKLNEKSKHQNKKKRAPLKDDMKKKNKLDKQMQVVSNQLNLFKNQMGLISGQPQKNNKILEEFQVKKDKLNEIEWKLNELIEQNLNKEKRITQLEEKLIVNKGHREHQKQLNQREIQANVNDNILKAQERIRVLQQCFTIIQENRTPPVSKRSYQI